MTRVPAIRQNGDPESVFFFPETWELTTLHTCISTNEICEQCTCKRWWAEKYADYCETLSQQENTRSISEAGSVFKGFWPADLWLAYALLSDTPDRRVNTDHKWTTCSYSSSKYSVAVGLPPLDFSSRSSWLMLRLPAASSRLPQPSNGSENDNQTSGRFPVLVKIVTGSFQVHGLESLKASFIPLNKTSPLLVSSFKKCRWSWARALGSP